MICVPAPPPAAESQIPHQPEASVRFSRSVRHRPLSSVTLGSPCVRRSHGGALSCGEPGRGRGAPGGEVSPVRGADVTVTARVQAATAARSRLRCPHPPPLPGMRLEPSVPQLNSGVWPRFISCRAAPPASQSPGRPPRARGVWPGPQPLVLRDTLSSEFLSRSSPWPRSGDWLARAFQVNQAPTVCQVPAGAGRRSRSPCAQGSGREVGGASAAQRRRGRRGLERDLSGSRHVGGAWKGENFGASRRAPRQPGAQTGCGARTPPRWSWSRPRWEWRPRLQGRQT